MSEENQVFTVLKNADELFRIYADGRVTKNPDVSWDDCAVAFFDALDRLGSRRSLAFLQEENAKLRAAIDRVRALHVRTKRFPAGWCDECNSAFDCFAVPHPCPTLRALDGEDA